MPSVQAQVSTQPLALVQPAPQPPPATSSREEEVKVEDELDSEDEEPPEVMLPRQPATISAAQPTRKSMRVHKPSSLARRIEAGEGIADGDLSTYAEDLSAYDDMLTLITVPVDDNLEWAYVMLPNADGDPKTIAQVQSCPDWPNWEAAMDCEIKSLEEKGT